MTVGHAFQDVLEIGEGLDVVELCSGDEGADGCPSDPAAVRAREQVVFAAKRDGPDGALDRIVVGFDAAVWWYENAEGLQRCAPGYQSTSSNGRQPSSPRVNPAGRTVLYNLIKRGLRRPEFLIVDGAPELDKAIASVWDGVPVQRCTVHQHRNLFAHAP